MAKAGRKRKSAKRTPSGQLSRAGHDPRDYGTPELRHLAVKMQGKGTMALMTDRMCAAGLITDAQNQASGLFREFRNMAYGQPGARVGAYSDMVSEGTLRAIPDLDPDMDPQARAEKAYLRGWNAVHERGRRGAAVELVRVVIDNAAPVERDFDAFVEALDILAALYIGGEKKPLAHPFRSVHIAHEIHTGKCA